MKSSVMKDIGERFLMYSMRFPDEVINAQEEIKIIETEIESKFDEDLGNIKKIMNDKKLSININFKEFENSIYLIKQALYTHTKVPEKSGDILRFYISNLYICKNVLNVIVRYIHQSIIDRIQRSYGDYEKRTNNVLIKDL
jgi:hypothetical protein